MEGRREWKGERVEGREGDRVDGRGGRERRSIRIAT